MEVEITACCFNFPIHSELKRVERDCLFCSVHYAQVPESFCWQKIIANYDYEEDNTILDWL